MPENLQIRDLVYREVACVFWYVIQPYAESYAQPLSCAV